MTKSVSLKTLGNSFTKVKNEVSSAPKDTWKPSGGNWEQPGLGYKGKGKDKGKDKGKGKGKGKGKKDI